MCSETDLKHKKKVISIDLQKSNFLQRKGKTMKEKKGNIWIRIFFLFCEGEGKYELFCFGRKKTEYFFVSISESFQANFHLGHSTAIVVVNHKHIALVFHLQAR